MLRMIARTPGAGDALARAGQRGPGAGRARTNGRQADLASRRRNRYRPRNRARSRRGAVPVDRDLCQGEPNGPKLNTMLARANRPIASSAAAVISVSETGNALSPWTSPSAFICARSCRNPAMNCTW